MAERRMFALKIIDSDAFLDMPASSQSLYFHLSMRADDDGFISNPKRIMRMIGASDDDIKILLSKRFLLAFDTGIVVIKHWRLHNYIAKDRYHETIYKEEKDKLFIKENGSYTDHREPVLIPHTDCIQDVDTGKVSLGKGREGEERQEEGSKETPDKPAKRTSFQKPTLEEVMEYCKERGNKVIPEKWYNHYESNGWMVGKNKMKDWKAAVRTWEHNRFDSGSAYSRPSPLPEKEKQLCPACGGEVIGGMCTSCRSLIGQNGEII